MHISMSFTIFLMPKTSATTITRAVKFNYGFDIKDVTKLNVTSPLGYRLIKERFIDAKTKKPISGMEGNDGSIFDRTGKKIITTGHKATQNCFLDKDTVLLFVLRHPVDRIISWFSIMQKQMKHSLEDIFINKRHTFIDNIPDKTQKNKILYFGIQGNIPWMHNFYCHALSGKSIVETNPVDEQICDIIVENLKNNCVVFEWSGRKIKVPAYFGITENNASTLTLFAKIMKWKNFDINEFYKKMEEGTADKNYRYRECNLNTAIKTKPPSDKLLQAIQECNPLDMKLYNQCLKLFEKQFQTFNVKYIPNNFYLKYTKNTITI